MDISDEDTELLRRADRLFDELLDLPEVERETALQRLTDQPALQSLVRKMLESHSRSGILDAPAPIFGGTPRSIGPWRIGDELGRGGMAVVYRGERDLGDGVQAAAVKLLTIGALAAHGSERFLREQSILARLDHPHIAGLLDAGVLADGTPWLAMALIDGERIDAWCANRKLGTQATVRLFMDVCDAVDHAHRRLIVHRDLKPSNILVGEDGRVRLLDFGIARLLDDGERDATATAFRALTPRYAAPEQFRGDPTTTASDVFGLGAVLYHLLAGRPPRMHPGDRDETITLPSRAVRQNAELPEPSRLARSRELAGDLDTILLKALAAEPERRYASAAGLAADLRAWLEHRPILARPGSIGYLTSRFLRRNRLAASVAMLFIFLAVAGIWQVATQSQRAEAQARRAVEVRNFLAEVLTSAQPTSGPIPSLLDVLDEASKRAREKLVDSDPLAAADVLLITGDTYTVADENDKSNVDLALAHTLLMSVQPPPARELANVFWIKGVNAKHFGSVGESIQLFEQALAWNARVKENTLQRIKIERSLAGSQASAGELDSAETTLRRLLEGVDRDRIRDTELHLGMLNSLSYVLSIKGVAYAERVDLNDQRLQVSRKLYGADSGSYGYALADSVSTLRKAGDIEQAERNARDSVRITDAAFTEPHTFSAVATCNLAALLKMQGRLQEALPYYDRVVVIDEALARGQLHAESCRRERAMTRMALGDFEGSRSDLVADRLMLEKLGKQQSTLWLATCGLDASMLVREGKAYAAKKLLDRCAVDHSPPDGGDSNDFDLARAEVAILEENWTFATTTLEALRIRIPPEPTSRSWLRPWLLSVYAAARLGNESTRDRLVKQVLGVEPVAGMKDLEIATACLQPDPQLSDCLVLP